MPLVLALHLFEHNSFGLLMQTQDKRMVWLDLRQKNDNRVKWRSKIAMEIIEILKDMLSIRNVFIFNVAVSCKIILRVTSALNYLF